MRRVFAGALAVVALVATGCGSSGNEPAQSTTKVGGDWTRFGYDAARSNNGPAATGITAANVRSLTQQRVELGGTADSSPIYLRGALVRGGRHDVFVVTTSYGRTVAVDAGSGAILWRFTPPDYSSWAGTAQITNSSPVADPTKRFVYAAAPDGRIYKLALGSGAKVWSVAITRDPTHEKLGVALNYARGVVYGTTGGYFGDAPPYQGHVAVISGSSGRLVTVWNALCSGRHRLLVPRTCATSGAAIWARSGVVIDPRTGNLLVATGNGHYDGRTSWGDSALMLTPNAGRLLQSWTPRNQAALESGDVDLGSTAPALVTPKLAVQGGKDGKLRLLDLHRLGGLGRTGGELQTVPTPGGLYSTPAVADGRVFIGTSSGTWCYRLRGNRLRIAWRRSDPGTSPVLAGGLLYVYDPAGGLNVFRPATGAIVARLPAGAGHWSSPIVTDGRIGLPEGDANDHSLSGVLNIYSLPHS